MNETLSVSAKGLRLIKAFEGYRPVDRMLVTGTRVVGYGHRLIDGEAVTLTRDEAHDTLLDDLAPFEDMINENVFAPISQSQFDALTSLAFNIGPRSFLDSDVLHAINAGRPLEAANAFDQWRMSNIAGKTFVVDALVRRRTAEKALFLRGPKDGLAAKAPQSDIRPLQDPRVIIDDDPIVLTRDNAGKLVADAPYEMDRLITDMPRRRRDDEPSGEMALSDFDADNVRPATIYSGLDAVLTAPLKEDETESDTPWTETAANEDSLELDTPISPIAEAADDVRARLDALMDVDDIETVAESEIEWPESLITADIAETETFDRELNEVIVEDDALDLDRYALPDGPEPVENIVAFPARNAELPILAEPAKTDIIIDNLAQDDAMGERRIITDGDGDWTPRDTPSVKGETAWPYLFIMGLGGALFGAGAVILHRGLELIFGQPGRLVGLGSAMIGGMILLGALGYLIKHIFQEGDTA